MPRALLGQTLSTLFSIAAWRVVDADDADVEANDDYTDTDDNGADDDKDGKKGKTIQARVGDIKWQKPVSLVGFSNSLAKSGKGLAHWFFHLPSFGKTSQSLPQFIKTFSTNYWKRFNFTKKNHGTWLSDMISLFWGELTTYLSYSENSSWITSSKRSEWNLTKPSLEMKTFIKSVDNKHHQQSSTQYKSRGGKDWQNYLEPIF